MSLPALCAGCSLGHHDKHDGEHHGAPGLIGGTYCPCTGDCKPPDLSEIFPVSAGTSEGRLPVEHLIDRGAGVDTSWLPGDPCGSCGSRDTVLIVDGRLEWAECRACGRSDNDD